MKELYENYFEYALERFYEENGREAREEEYESLDAGFSDWCYFQGDGYKIEG